jgi:prepilin-type N-terminal cleavage/methylation domain-containing protein
LTSTILKLADKASRLPVRVTDQKGLTLFELMVVVGIIAASSALLLTSFGPLAFWKEQSFLRRFSDTVEFLHHQAVSDQAFYVLEMRFGSQSEPPRYSIGTLRPEEDIAGDLVDIASDAGNLTLELAAFLNPSMGSSHTIIPPPNYPSLAEPVVLPESISFEEVRTMRGKQMAEPGGSAYITFSPRGFSEFAVIHFKNNGGEQVTILVNPFTGRTERFNEYKDFEWTYGTRGNVPTE